MASTPGFEPRALWREAIVLTTILASIHALDCSGNAPSHSSPDEGRKETNLKSNNHLLFLIL